MVGKVVVTSVVGEVPLAAALPPGEMVLEGETFPAPRCPERFLEAMYGYLGEGAVYCAATGKYVDPSSAAAVPHATK